MAKKNKKVALIIPKIYIDMMGLTTHGEHKNNAGDIVTPYPSIQDFLEQMKSYKIQYSRVIISEYGGLLLEFPQALIKKEGWPFSKYIGTLLSGNSTRVTLSLTNYYEYRKAERGGEEGPFVISEQYDDVDDADFSNPEYEGLTEDEIRYLKQEDELRFIREADKERDERYQLLSEYYEGYVNPLKETGFTVETVYVPANPVTYEKLTDGMGNEDEYPALPDISSNIWEYIGELSNDPNMLANTYWFVPEGQELGPTEVKEYLPSTPFHELANKVSDDNVEVSEYHQMTPREYDLFHFFEGLRRRFDTTQDDFTHDYDDVYEHEDTGEWSATDVQAGLGDDYAEGYVQPMEEAPAPVSAPTHDTLGFSTPAEEPPAEEPVAEEVWEPAQVEWEKQEAPDSQYDEDTSLGLPVADNTSEAIMLTPIPVEDNHQEVWDSAPSYEHPVQQDWGATAYDDSAPAIVAPKRGLLILAGAPTASLADEIFGTIPDDGSKACVVNLTGQTYGVSGSVENPAALLRDGHRLSAGERPYTDQGIDWYAPTLTHPYSSVAGETKALGENLQRLLSEYDLIVVECASPSVLEVIPAGVPYELRYVFGDNPESLYHFFAYTSLIPKAVQGTVYEKLQVTLPPLTDNVTGEPTVLGDDLEKHKRTYIPFTYNWLNKVG